MRQMMVAGNWKMNGSIALVERMASRLREALAASGAGGDAAQLVVCPPFPLLPEAARAMPEQVAMGAQNVSEYGSGAYTGEVAASMLAEAGCRYVIVGHSERRSLHGEDNPTVAAKFAAAKGAGLVPILCVGETLAERDAERTETVVGEQLAAVTEHCGDDAFANAVVAYEPVWAIGTGRSATPDQAQAVHAFIRRRIAEVDADSATRLQVLYGGSMKADNAADLLALPDVDGGLIGGASLDPDGFAAIHQSALDAGPTA